MPFVSLDDIKPFISDGLFNALNKNNTFALIEAEAAIFIKKTFNLDIPTDVSDAPAYIKRPMAMIIQKFARSKLQNISSEFMDVQESIIDKEYNWSIDYLASQTAQVVNSNIGTINGVDQW